MDSQKPWLIFDLDDTLIPSSHIYEKIYSQMKLGSSFQRARKMAKQRQNPGHTSAHHRLIYFKCYLENLGRPSPQKILRLNERYEKLLAKEVRSFVRKSKLISELKFLKKHYRLAIFTNETLRTQLIKLNEIDPKGQLFEQILTSEEIGQEKKVKTSFSKLLKILKAPAHSCTMVGDDKVQDILPSRKAGFRRSIKVLSAKDRDASYKLNLQIPEFFS